MHERISPIPARSLHSSLPSPQQDEPKLRVIHLDTVVELLEFCTIDEVAARLGNGVKVDSITSAAYRRGTPEQQAIIKAARAERGQRLMDEHYARRAAKARGWS
jgi:hypothetical protein